MKKVLLVLTALILTATYSFAGPGLYQITLDTSGTLESSAGDTDVKNGYSIVSEFGIPFKLGGFDVSIGTEYQLNREIEGTNSDIRFWNKYITLRKPLFANSFNSLTPVLRIGTGDVYTSNIVGTTDGGLFYSIGAEYKLAGLASAEITYSVNEAELNNVDYDYKRINFTWGTKFDGIYKAKKTYDSYSKY